MSRYVLDSFALLTVLELQRGMDRVTELIDEAQVGSVELHMSAINLVEVRYHIIRRGKNTKDNEAAIKVLPVSVASADAYLEQVAELEARYPISLADCFCAALAMDLDCPVVTGDPEFRKLESILQVEWLR